MKEAKAIYKIIFVQQNAIYEIYTRKISPSSMLGFIEAEELIFGEKSTLVLDPSEERLKTEFDQVRRCHIPLHHVIRIDEVVKEGIPKISELSDKKSNVSLFPKT